MAIRAAAREGWCHWARRVASIAMRGAFAASVMSAPGAFAGPTMDESLARHRALLDRDAPTRGTTPIGLDAGAPDGATLAIGGPGAAIPPLVRPMVLGEGGFAVRATTVALDGRVNARFGGYVAFGDDHPASLDGSSVDTALGAGRLYASVERRHWGPAWTGSLILDGGSRAVPAIGWRKADAAPFASRWLAWIGPWTADVFAGQLAQRTGPQHPKLFGARIQAMPVEGLELGASRVIQWGGSGRPETARSLWYALIGHDNSDVAGDGDDPSNQLAGFDARYTLRLGEARTVSVYLQTIGEDEAGYLPSRRDATYGADVSFAVGRVATVRAYAEYANTTARGGFGETPQFGVTYRTRLYPDGYTQLGRPLGHPVGGDIRLGSLGVLVDAGRWTTSAALHAGSAYPSSTLYPGGGRLRGAEAELAWQVDATSRLGVSVLAWRDPQTTTTRGQLWWQVAWP